MIFFCSNHLIVLVRVLGGGAKCYGKKVRFTKNKVYDNDIHRYEHRRRITIQHLSNCIIDKYVTAEY